MSDHREALSARLSRIDTSWTRLRQGLEGQAVEEFLATYGPPIRRYLLGITRGDEERSSELYQEFCLRLLKGRFRNADPEHGKFRHYLKRCLAALVADSWKKGINQATGGIPEGGEPIATADESAMHAEDAEYTAAWRQALFTAAFQNLAQEERRQPRGWYVVLKMRLEYPDDKSHELAARISASGKAVTDGWVRKRLMEARARFAELLIDEVGKTIENPGIDSVREELIDLGLWEYCRHYFEESPPE